jgi:hypothetical protein
LKDGYVPNEHWTSNLRAKAGYTEFTGERDESSFTLVDTGGLFTTVVARSGYPDAQAWKRRPPTWHLEVKSTRSGLSEKFYFSTEQFEKVCLNSLLNSPALR